jgi:hypothetical protein
MKFFIFLDDQVVLALAYHQSQILLLQQMMQLVQKMLMIQTYQNRQMVALMVAVAVACMAY